MISNRKGIAFVSKTPGKTSEFNYFDAQGRVGRKNDKHRFFLVDLPGVGYAEVRKELRASWLVLLRDYVVNRSTLRIVFHLIDSRHGILDTDEDCLSLLAVLPPHVQYVIVLTKVDKHNTGVRRDILERIADVVKLRTDRQVRFYYFVICRFDSNLHDNQLPVAILVIPAIVTSDREHGASLIEFSVSFLLDRSQ